MTELLRPFVNVLFRPPHQWHPAIIHFPIVFLLTEAPLAFLAWKRKSPELERLSAWCLHLGAWPMLLAGAFGLRDVGLDQGRGNLLLLGLQDRLKNAFSMHSILTVHWWLALVLMAVTFTRLAWRWWRGPSVLEHGNAFLYAALTFVNLWCLAATAYVGGEISHS